ANLDKLDSLVKAKPKALNAAVESLYRRVQAFEQLEHDLAIIPTAASASGEAVESRSGGEWLSPAALARTGGEISSSGAAIVRAYIALRKTYVENDRDGFAQAARELVEANHAAAHQLGVSMKRLKVDLINTRLEPFKLSCAPYLIAAVLYVAVVSVRAGRLAIGGLGLLVLGFAAHALGLVFRSILVGRAPMANMYESLVFAAVGAVALAIILDRVYRNPLIGLSGALIGFVCMVIAMKMPVSQSRINPLVPALQSSWLTYHVTTIMLSYSAFALSFLVSCLYLLRRAVGRRSILQSDLSDSSAPSDLSDLSDLSDGSDLALLDFYTYRIIAVGFPLLTIGIFTGAVWAATAWGRPWGFDPKETWSAITWLVYAVFLHTRFLGGWKGDRSAALAVLGFVSVLFTYLGVNYLLPGLHSYA
ncbi:c-type cytochrome biogenesis protein CcsB, partial [Candidatus Sumerlaeota bacterium]|nr:c-type cytochrome biogenesis protein CcsB [Candidatus Sumerlaeota bacterium]